MKEHILMLSESTSLLCLIAIFVLLFVIILKVLRQQSFFGKNTTVVLSLCVSLLCIIGLCQPFIPTGKGNEVSGNSERFAPDLDLILLLYAALAIALLLSPLLWFITKIFRGDKYKKGSKRLNRRPEKYDHLSDLYKPRLKRDEDRFTK